MIKTIIGRIAGMLGMPKKGDVLSLNIGESFSRLKMAHTVSYIHNGKYMQVGSEQEWRWVKYRKRVCADLESEPNPHLLITGMSGHGKSTLLESIVRQLSASGKNVLVFDVHNEHGSASYGKARMVDAHYNSVNPLALDGLAVNQRISGTVSMLKSLYGLGHIQSTKLSQCLWYVYRRHGAMSPYSTELGSMPTINELMNEIGIFVSNSKGATERNALLHLKAKISGLAKPSFIKDTISVKELMSGLNLISLADIKSREELFVYVTTILERIYYLMRANRINGGVRTYVVIDEAQYLIGSSGDSASIIRKLVEEGRKYGIAVIMATPSISSIDKRILANASTIMSFALREPTEVSYMSKLMSSGTSAEHVIRSALPKLRIGEILLTNSKNGTLLVRVSRGQATNGIQSFNTASAERAAAMSVKPIKAGALASEVGSDTVTSMIKSGELATTSVETKGGTEEWVMRKSGAFTIEHELMIRRIAELLSKSGITNRIEDNANNPDIVAYYNGKRIAIEYETGSKSSASTMQMLERRKGKYDYIVVVTSGSRLHEGQRNHSKS